MQNKQLSFLYHFELSLQAEKKAVKAPMKVIKFKIKGEYSNVGLHLIIKKIPAVTIVAACISAETGVGPSMASGNQVCNPI